MDVAITAPQWLGYGLKDWVSIAKDVLISIVALITAFVALRGLNSWRESFTSQSKHKASARLVRTAFTATHHCFSFCMQAESLLQKRSQGHSISRRDLEQSQKYRDICEEATNDYRFAYWEADSVLPKKAMSNAHTLGGDIQSLFNLTLDYFDRLHGNQPSELDSLGSRAEEFIIIFKEQKQDGLAQILERLVLTRKQLDKFLMR